MTNISRSINQKLGTLSGVLLALLLSLTGCQKERFVPEEDLGYRHTAEFDEGSTYMSLALRGSNPPASSQQTEDQTGGNYQVTWQGDDIIENFAVYIISEDSPEVKCIARKVTDTEVVENWDPAKQELLLKPFKTNPVNKKVYAFFNPPVAYLKKLESELDNKVKFENLLKEPIPFQGAQGVTYDGEPTGMDAFHPDTLIATKRLYIGLGKDGYGDDIMTSFKLEDIPSFGTEGEIRKNAEFALDPFYQVSKLDFLTQKPHNFSFYKYADRILSTGVRSFLPEDNVSKESVVNEKRNLVQVYTRRALAQAVVSTDAEALLNPCVKGMRLMSVNFQALNFEPSFYPVAQTETEGEWPGNGNTKSPLYTSTDGTTLINFSTYTPTVKINGETEEFNPYTFASERFFHSAHIFYEGDLKVTDPQYAQKLLRQVQLKPNAGQGPSFLMDGSNPPDPGDARNKPVATTTFWGSCYVTETTHKWAEDGTSGYKTSNTPFFAVIASFDGASLPWAENIEEAYNLLDSNKQQEFNKLQKVVELDSRINPIKQQLEIAQAELESKLGPVKAKQKDLIDFVDPLPMVNKGKPYPPGDKAWEDLKVAMDKYNKGIATSERLLRNFPTSTVKRYITTIKRGIGTANAAVFDTKWQAYLTESRKEDIVKAKIKCFKLNFDIKNLEGEKEELWKDEFSPMSYPTNDKLSPILFERGINRLYYSQADGKFYFDYHDIPKGNRFGVEHHLSTTDSWLQELQAAIEAKGWKLPTKENGVIEYRAVLPPTQKLLDKLSDLLNGIITTKDLSPIEMRSMDLYLYGRVAPFVMNTFDSKHKGIEQIDLRAGFIEWYTAKNKDQVVNYESYLRTREEQPAAKGRYIRIGHPRLLMVYYAWINPNTGDPSNSYASPVLRNNIYHMHIMGFTKMGLSAIPFVPEQPNGSKYRFLHKFDPDEAVPAKGVPLPQAGGTGQPAQTSALKSSYLMKF
ncbi:fimbria major subunit [uncultured Porphyromonas sp.]|uniref:fimbria major subunit n=1 Tax=uncultured Porphyromonas sp. TaxID=159274 RepID=UPI00258CBBEB|nr:fimbria major subunit [uncultured Porphyromonas sp.]